MPLKRKFILNPEKTLAILIGIDQYEDFARVDPAPSNVSELAKVLADEQIFGLPRSRIKIIVGGKSADIKEALFDIFEKLHGQGLETLIFYFVGHGFRRPNGDYYLAAEDSKKRLLRMDGSTGIAYSTVKKIIKESGIPQRLIFLDSCYSGSTTLSGASVIEDMRLKGTYTISSSDAREVSYFDTEHMHTLFTGELLKILKAGINQGGERIRLDELYGALKLAVRERNPKMSPQQLGSEEITGGNYLLCKNLQYNAQADHKVKISGAIALGDQHLKAKALQQAEHQYLKAKHLAEEYGLMPVFQSDLQNRMEKLRFAEELQGEWKGKQAEGGEPPQASAVGTLLKKNKAVALLLAVVMVGVLGMIVFKAVGGGEAGQGLVSAGQTGGGQGLPGLVSEDSVLVGSGRPDPGRQLSGPEIIDNIGKNMSTISGGSYTRGCTFEQADDCNDDEKHVTTVKINAFQMNRYEVTQEEWRAVMGNDPEELTFKGCDRCPVERVSWREVMTFIQRLNEKTGMEYRLPSESEWEYAARGGSRSQEFKYAGNRDLKKIAWYMENSGGKTHPTGLLAPNELGLYDMSGNVYEWCQDHFQATYEGAPTDGSAWESPGVIKRVLRGGSWDHPEGRSRVSSRSSWRPDKRYKDVGLRLAHSINPEGE